MTSTPAGNFLAERTNMMPELTKDQSRVILRRTLRISGIVNLVATGVIVSFAIKIKYSIWKV